MENILLSGLNFNFKIKFKKQILDACNIHQYIIENKSKVIINLLNQNQCIQLICNLSFIFKTKISLSALN